MPHDDIRVAAHAVLEHGVVLKTRVRGGSMRPLLWEQDQILVQPLDQTSCVPGDVVLFDRQDALVAHRVIQIKNLSDGRQQYLTRGDCLSEADLPVDRSSVLGKIVAVERSGRTISLDRDCLSRVIVWVVRVAPWLFPVLRRWCHMVMRGA